jgi:hypothetical protein
MMPVNMKAPTFTTETQRRQQNKTMLNKTRILDFLCVSVTLW